MKNIKPKIIHAQQVVKNDKLFLYNVFKKININIKLGHPWSCLFNNCRGYMGPDNKHFG